MRHRSRDARTPSTFVALGFVLGYLMRLRKHDDGERGEHSDMTRKVQRCPTPSIMNPGDLGRRKLAWWETAKRQHAEVVHAPPRIYGHADEHDGRDMIEHETGSEQAHAKQSSSRGTPAPSMRRRTTAKLKSNNIGRARTMRSMMRPEPDGVQRRQRSQNSDIRHADDKRPVEWKDDAP